MKLWQTTFIRQVKSAARRAFYSPVPAIPTAVAGGKRKQGLVQQPTVAIKNILRAESSRWKERSTESILCWHNGVDGRCPLASSSRQLSERPSPITDDWQQTLLRTFQSFLVIGRLNTQSLMNNGRTKCYSMSTWLHNFAVVCLSLSTLGFVLQRYKFS